MQFSITGDDQIVLNGIGLVANISDDLADGDVAALTVPNDLINMAVGKNGNAIYAKDESGRKFELELRVLKGSAADNALLSKYNTYLSNFAGLEFITGSITKQLGNGLTGSEKKLQQFVFQLSGGVIRKAPESRTNVNGDTEQSITVYNIMGVIDSISIGSIKV